MKPKKDDGMQQFTPESRLDAYLKKDVDLSRIRADAEKLTLEESKRLAREQVMRKQSVFQGNRWESFKDRLKRTVIWRSNAFRRIRGMRQFRYETLPLLLFSSFAMYIAWSMEDKLDHMKRRVVRSKTLREEENERENRLLTGALSGDEKYQDVPIASKSDPIWKYRIDRGEDNDDDRLVANPHEEYAHPDLSPDEMSSMMKQYEDHASRLMGGNRQLPNPGYSKDPEANRKNIARYKPQKPHS